MATAVPRWRRVTVTSSKWNGDPHRSTPSLELGSDEFGTWLWMPPGTIAQTPTGGFDAIPGLRLIPIGQMWSAYFMPSYPIGSRPHSTYVDITTINQRAGDVFTFVDLDLDVEAVDDGPPIVLDRDEFADHARDWNYPASLVRAAEATCDSVEAALTNHTARFDNSYLIWWQQVV